MCCQPGRKPESFSQPWRPGEPPEARHRSHQRVRDILSVARFRMKRAHRTPCSEGTGCRTAHRDVGRPCRAGRARCLSASRNRATGDHQVYQKSIGNPSASTRTGH